MGDRHTILLGHNYIREWPNMADAAAGEKANIDYVARLRLDACGIIVLGGGRSIGRQGPYSESDGSVA